MRKRPDRTRLIRFILFLMAGLVVVLSSPASGAPIPQGDTQVTSIDKLKISLGIQYRVMYNLSNIPGPGGTAFPDDTHNYDFFRQRLRLNIDMQPSDKAGGFVQLEYRGGWGGSSPEFSDPRDGDPTVNAFNRLQARGVRYGYLYLNPEPGHYLSVGILPVSDQFGDTLFSADWDFNVGGILHQARTGMVEHRFAYLRLVDTVNSDVKSDLGRDGNIFLADLNFDLKPFTVGAHVYYLAAGKVTDPLADPLLQTGRTDEVWYGVTASGKAGPAAVNAFFVVNDGETNGSGDHTGYALKLEGSAATGPASVSLLGIYTTGDKPGEVDDRFTTIQSYVGTQGYWAYTHIFTANGPSDVNDLGVRIDNGGSGLLTVQGKVSAPIVGRLSGDLVAGLFQAVEKNLAGDDDMGTEYAGMLTLEVEKNLVLQAGAAFAYMGDFFGTDPDNLREVFSRFQLQF